MESIGIILAIGGSTVSICGAAANNLFLDHVLAMRLWRISNWVMLVWAVGYTMSWWNGGLAGVALVAMYATYAVTNEYGLRKEKGEKMDELKGDEE